MHAFGGGPVNETLEELEDEYWDEPEFDSCLAKTCHELRKKPISQFSAEDLRIMIAQNIGLTHLIPEALNRLRKQPLLSGNLYEGDLLNTLIGCDWAKKGTDSNLNTLLVLLCRMAMTQLERSQESVSSQDAENTLHPDDNSLKTSVPYRDFAEFCRKAERN